MTYPRISAAAIVFASALAVPAGAQASSYQDAVLADGPLVYHQMETQAGGIVQDASPNDRDGQLTGMAALVGTGPFLGASNALSLGRADGMTATVGATSGSVEMWVNPARLRRGEQAGFVAHGDPAANGWAVGVGAKRKLTFVTGNVKTRSRVSLPAEAWSMLNVSWSGGKVTFAINGGASVKSVNLSSIPSSQDGGMVLGGTARGAFSGSYAGRMDEVALFSQPLSVTDAKRHFAAAQIPVNTTPVVIDGTPAVGSPIVVQPGVWTGTTEPPTYQWQRCDANGDDCDDIPNATQPTYLVTEADACSTLRVIETRTNANGTTTTVSEASALVPCPTTGGGETGGGEPGGGDTGGGGTGGGDGTGTGTGTADRDGTTGTGTDTSGTGSTGGDASAIGTPSGDVPSGDIVAAAAAPVATDAAAAATASAGRATCLKLVSGRRTVKLRKLGTLRLRIAGNGCLKPGSPLRLSFAKAKGKQIKSVQYRLAGKALRVAKRRSHAAAVTSAKLRAGVRVLKVRVAPKAGKARTVTLKLRFAKG